jgi:WD40 repeat protein
MMIATGGSDNRVLLFDASNGKLLREIKGPDFAESWDRIKAKSPFRALGDRVSEEMARFSFELFGATTDIAFSPVGDTIAAAGGGDPEEAVRLYDVATGALRWTAMPPQTGQLGHEAHLESTRLAFDSDGKRIAAAAGSDYIGIYDAATGVVEQMLASQGVTSILLTSDGLSLVSARSDGSISLWCATTGQLVVTLRAHHDAVGDLRFNDDQTLFASPSRDGTTLVWRVPASGALCDKLSIPRIRAMEPLARLEGHSDLVQQALFLVGGERLLTTSRDKTIRTWRLAERGTARITPTTRITPAAQWGAGDVTALWADRPNGLSFSLMGRRTGNAKSAFSGSGRYLFVRDISYSDHEFTIWSVDGSHLVAKAPGEQIAMGIPGGKIGLYKNPFSATIFDPDEQLPTMVSPDAEPPKKKRQGNFNISVDGRRAIGSIDWLAYRDLLTRDPDKPGTSAETTPILFDPGSGLELSELRVDDFFPATLSDVHFSPDGKLVVAALQRGGRYEVGKDDGAMLAAWDAESGQLVAQSGKFARIVDLEISGDHSLVSASVQSGKGSMLRFLFRIRDASFSTVASWDSQQISAETLSPDGHLLAIGNSKGSLSVLQTADLSVVAGIDGPDREIEVVAVSPDDRLLAIADRANAIRIVDISSGEVLAAPVFRAATVILQFDPSSQRVAAVLANNEIQIIEVAPLPDLAGDRFSVLDWVRGSDLFSMPAAEARRLRLAIPGRVARLDLVGMKPAEVGPQPSRPPRPHDAAKCDTLAALPDDSEKPAPGVNFTAIDGPAAVAACAAAAQAMPNDPVSAFEYGRALLRVGKTNEAMAMFKKASDNQYGAAARDLALLTEGNAEATGYGPSEQLWDVAAHAGDPVALRVVAALRALAATSGAEFDRALSLALAAGSAQLSAAVLQLAGAADARSPATAPARRRVLFLYELGLWIADNVESEGPSEIRLLRSSTGERVRELSREVNASEVVELWRAARHWSPGQAPP